MDIQAFIKALDDATAGERSKYHLTLGGLIRVLDDSTLHGVVRFEDAHQTGPLEIDSYRGYYSDIAVTAGSPPSIQDALKNAQSALGAEFDGYKGGEYKMTADTPLWRSEYGRASGEAIVGAFVEGGDVYLQVKRVDA